MGSKKSSAPKPVQVQAPDTTAIQQQYQQSLAAIQQQNALALNQLTKANENSVAALQAQLNESTKINTTYQQQLTNYLQQAKESQLAQQKAISERDLAVTEQQKLQRQEIEGTSLQNNLLAANQVAASTFKQRTGRKRGFIV